MLKLLQIKKKVCYRTFCYCILMNISHSEPSTKVFGKAKEKAQDIRIKDSRCLPDSIENVKILSLLGRLNESRGFLERTKPSLTIEPHYLTSFCLSLFHAAFSLVFQALLGGRGRAL